MEPTILKRMSQLFRKGDKVPLEHAQKLIDETLRQPWIEKLLVFGDYAVFVMDLNTMKYLYVSPNVEQVYGYERSYFNDITSIASLLHPQELQIIPAVAEKAIAVFSDPKLTPSERYQLRFSRNYWGFHKDGTPINVLVHSIPLAFTDERFVQLELLIAANIKSFNDSPHHFYRVVKTSPNGAEEILLSGIYEQDITPLSSREREVFEQVTKGATSEEIAHHLGISIETVKTYRKAILQKTGSENSLQLQRMGYARGWY